MAVVAARWAQILRDLQWRVRSLAGEGEADSILPGLAIGAPSPPTQAELTEALAEADLVLVENLCSIPLNLPAARLVAQCAAARRAIFHHHDLPWQRRRFAHVTELPPVGAQGRRRAEGLWRHVTVNRLSERQLAERGISAVTIYNPFDVCVSTGERGRVRKALGVAPEELLAVHPVRAIERKNIPQAIEVCEQLGATYWLTGPPEEGYEQALEAILARARCRVLRGSLEGVLEEPHKTQAVDAPKTTLVDLYSAADLVVFTSTWEGFGNPPLEASVHFRPSVVSTYPVAEELRALGFRWFYPNEITKLRERLSAGGSQEARHNRKVAERHFAKEEISRQIAKLLAEMGF